MSVLLRFVCASPSVLWLCFFSVTSALLLPSASAQEMLRLPDFTVDSVKPVADEGSSEALYILAAVYFKGKRVPRDYKKASELLTRAGEQGLALAQLHLGEMFYTGDKIPQNDSSALRWYQMASLQGLPLAQYGLGNIYASGRGTTQDYREAMRWYEQAALQGHDLSQYEMGILYATGTGVAKDTIKGYMWLALSAAQGNAQASSYRDNIRAMMTPEQIALAQSQAGSFKAIPHYNRDQLTKQTKAILEKAQGIIDAK